MAGRPADYEVALDSGATSSQSYSDFMVSSAGDGEVRKNILLNGTTWNKTAIRQHNQAMVELLRDDLRKAGHDI